MMMKKMKMEYMRQSLEITETNSLEHNIVWIGMISILYMNVCSVPFFYTVSLDV